MSDLTVPDVLPLVWAYVAKPGNSVGGSLHIILDDGNVEDEHVQFCVGWARLNNDPDGEKLAEAFLRLSRTQRRKVCSRAYKARDRSNSLTGIFT